MATVAVISPSTGYESYYGTFTLQQLRQTFDQSGFFLDTHEDGTPGEEVWWRNTNEPPDAEVLRILRAMIHRVPAGSNPYPKATLTAATAIAWDAQRPGAPVYAVLRA